MSTAHLITRPTKSGGAYLITCAHNLIRKEKNPDGQLVKVLPEEATFYLRMVGLSDDTIVAYECELLLDTIKVHENYFSEQISKLNDAFPLCAYYDVAVC